MPHAIFCLTAQSGAPDTTVISTFSLFTLAYGQLGLGDTTYGTQNYGFVQQSGRNAYQIGFGNITTISRFGFSDTATSNSYSLFCAINNLFTVFCWG
jgi:hypothetical protein